MTDANFHLKVDKKNAVIVNLVLVEQVEQKLMIKKSCEVNFACLHSWLTH